MCKNWARIIVRFNIIESRMLQKCNILPNGLVGFFIRHRCRENVIKLWRYILTTQTRMLSCCWDWWKGIVYFIIMIQELDFLKYHFRIEYYGERVIINVWLLVESRYEGEEVWTKRKIGHLLEISEHFVRVLLSVYSESLWVT